MSGVRIEDLDIHFDRFHAVDKASFTVADGELVSLLGPSGCGKTTILRTVAGLIDATGGEIWIGNDRVSAPARGVLVPPERRNLGMVFQSYAIWPHMTVAENVGYPLKVRKLPSAEIAQRVARMLDIVGLTKHADKAATDLSGGQQQRIAIARALVFEPKVLLLDEPLSNLDTKLRVQMGFELKRIQERTGVTTIYVTHDQGEALALSDRIVVLNQGRIQQIGTPEEIYERPANAFVGWFIGHANFLNAEIVALHEAAAGEELRSADVRLDGGAMLHCRLSAGRFDVGEQVLVSARPEDVHVANGNGTHLHGTVRSSGYFGERRQHTVQVGDREVEFFTPRNHSFRSGEEVALWLDPLGSLALKSDGMVPHA